MQGKIVKGISGFYYVHVVGTGIYECKAKGVFRNRKVKPLVGDNVEIVVLDEEKHLGNVEEILPRKNELIRPAVSNIDMALVIFAAAKPNPNFNLLDRFLCMMEYQKVPVTICFNKCDLVSEEEKENLQKIYAPAGYDILFTSVKTGENIDRLKALLAEKTTTVAGPSGVGKSSLINELQTDVRMQTGAISDKIGRGKHTTRHSEIFPLGRILILWIRLDSVLWICRDLKKKIYGHAIQSLFLMSRNADLSDAVISENRIVVLRMPWRKEKSVGCGMTIM